MNPDDDSAPTAMHTTRAYHQRSKHRPGRFAASLGYLDWESQPDPFLRFEGSPTFALEREPIGPVPEYEPAFVLGRDRGAPLDLTSVSRLFFDSLALSAWKEVPGSRWALRVNPSSGNLHPTEGYLVSGPVPGLNDSAGVYHYAPRAHALELRVELPEETWAAVAAQLPNDALLVGLTSIYWREAWKYGERAFRYCNHDLGHAIACVSIAAAGLGWEARLLEGVPDQDLAALLGIHAATGPEAEHPECLMAVFPQSASLGSDRQKGFRLETAHVAELREARWHGERNELSKDHHDWPAIGAALVATKKHAPPNDAFWAAAAPSDDSWKPGDSRISLREMIHQRRSAVALDGRTGMTCNAFYQILRKTMPGAKHVPFTTLPWRPRVDLLLFVHRVESLTPGLYALVRDPHRLEALKSATDAGFAWRPIEDESAPTGLFFLEEGDARRAAQQTSCNQAIAADGVFAAAMLCEYEAPLEEFGPWFYRRLYWETGVVGQALYLEAEASSIRATGIGCFFDDVTHRMFGLNGERFQVLYHFTMGAAVDDPRLQTHPAYAHLESE